MKRFIFPCALSALLFANVANAFCRSTTIPASGGDCPTSGLVLFWKNACVGYKLVPPSAGSLTAQQVESGLRAAVDGWAAAACTPSIAGVSLGAASATADVGYTRNGTNENVVVFRTNTWPYDDKNQVALTTLTFRKDTGEILDADLEVNATLPLTLTDPVEKTSYDLQTVFAHESGHVFGLAHSDRTDATMYRSYKPGTSFQRTLSDDDETGICTIYPAGGTRVTATGSVQASSCDPNAQPDPGTDTVKSGCGCDTVGRPAPSVPMALWFSLGLCLAATWRICSKRTQIARARA